MLSGDMADIFSNLYLALSVKYYHHNNNASKLLTDYIIFHIVELICCFFKTLEWYLNLFYDNEAKHPPLAPCRGWDEFLSGQRR